tara:strand:+ start:135 stop:488 length:354 start_codon:yes stop_codon:yes gene_type:complete
VSALLPPNPDTPALYWLRHESGEPDEAWEWVPEGAFWHSGNGGSDAIDPGLMADLGYTFASATQRPIPTAAQMDAVYALTADPKPLEYPASAPFALGYHVGMEYAARKLREALGVTL